MNRTYVCVLIKLPKLSWEKQARDKAFYVMKNKTFVLSDKVSADVCTFVAYKAKFV